jgi:hypothetical protein
LRYRDTCTGTFVVLTIRITVDLPFGDQERIRVSQKYGVAAPPPPLETAAGVAVACRAAVSSVGKETGVFVAATVGLAVSVGGKGVSVGMAAFVSATIVCAAAMAVPCTSAGCAVGAGCAPHAAMMRLSIKVKQ